MSKVRRLASLVFVMVLIVTLFVGVTPTVLADQNNDGGSFNIFVFRDGEWQLQGELSFSDYETLQLPLSNDSGQLRLRLTQYGHDGAFVDYLALEKDAVTYTPVSAIDIDGNADVLTKILSPEYDVCDGWENTLEIVWENVPDNTTLVMRAMEEEFGLEHGGPLYYPIMQQGEILNHTLINDGGILADGLLEDLLEPDFDVFWQPDSPHPDGYTYGWLHCDGDYFYAAVEVTADNTLDEEDWGALFVMVHGEIREFRISDDQEQWGVSGFQYTSSVAYEHRIYEFQIPLSEISASIGNEIQYGFGCYGTVATVKIDFGDAPDPPYPTLIINSGPQHNYSLLYMGTTVDDELDGQPNATATGDDNNGLDDEGGVTFDTGLVQGSSAQITVTATGAGLLNAWIDWNTDGDWGDIGEQVFTDVTLVPGSNILNTNVPSGATPGKTFARFRLSTIGGLSYTGPAEDGEVEDYSITVTSAPEPRPHRSVGGIIYPVDKLVLLLPYVLGATGTVLGFLWLKRRLIKR